MAKRTRPLDLARETGLEIDDVLITLWDAGVDSVVSPNDLLPSGQVRTARDALGLLNPKELRSRPYWQKRLHLDEAEFDAVLESAGIHMTESSRRLPKGSVAKLRRIERVRFGASLSDARQPENPVKPEPKPLDWPRVGRDGEVVRLDEEEVLAIHYALVDRFMHQSDPISPPGPRSKHLLASATFRQQTSFGRTEKYPTAEMSAAALLHSIVVDHPFFNGNKRTAVVAAACLLYENKLRLTCSEDELFKIVLSTAMGTLIDRRLPDHADREVVALSQWIHHNTRRIDRRGRVLTWLKLRRVLTQFDVTMERASVGNRINLQRSREIKQGLLARRRTVPLHTQIASITDGDEVSRDVIAKIRSDLQLDERHGVDAGVFFDQKQQAEDVIVEYQRTLQRLAKR